MKKIFLGFLTIIIFALSLSAQDKPVQHPILIVIDGKFASQQALDTIPEEEIVQMHYLMSREARQLYGVAGAGGALLVKTERKHAPKVFLDGRPIASDSLNKLSFERMNVVRGQQAQNLYGAGVVGGVYLLKSAEERLNVCLEVKNAKGKPVRNAEIRDMDGEIIGKTNKCGMAFLKNLLANRNIQILAKSYLPRELSITESQLTIVLEKN